MKNSDKRKWIIIGIGNDSRQDDGLGWALLDLIKQRTPEKTELAYRYQLNIEDADLIRNAEKVLFLDACKDDIAQGCVIEKCTPNGAIRFTTHALSPSAILALCHQIYDARPDTYVLKMQGYEWALKVGLTIRGKKSLSNAIKLFSKFIKES